MKIPPAAALLLAVFLSCSLRAQPEPVDWQTLAAEFSEDAAAAQAKYQGQSLTVTGPVSSIAAGDMTTESDPAVAVTLSTPDGPGPDVKCLFENEDLEPNQKLSVPADNSEVLLRTTDAIGNVISSKSLMTIGRPITVSGTFYGYDAGDIVLRHARLSGGTAAP